MDVSKKALEHTREQVEQLEEENSPEPALNDPVNPSTATATPHDAHSTHKHPDDARNEHQVKTITQSRKPGPGGQICMQIGLENVKHDLMHRNKARGVRYDGNRCQMDVAMSSTHHKSKHQH